jgi:hypothetical protein
MNKFASLAVMSLLLGSQAFAGPNEDILAASKAGDRQVLKRRLPKEQV